MFKKITRHCWTLLNCTIWMLLFSSIFILLVKTDQGYSAHDATHPIYELSIGNSFKQNLFNPPDLSYQGRAIRYHFLGTLLPHFFIKTFNARPLDAAYFYSPMLLLFMFFGLLYFFFKKYPRFKTPVVFIFFTPFWIFSGYYSCLFGCTIWVTSSIFLATVLSLLSIILLLEEQWFWLVISTSLLLITKASFFMSICGGVVLYLLRQKRFKALSILSTIFGAIFLVCFWLFFSGAHAHNFWIVFPHFVRAAFFDTNNQHVITFLLIILSAFILLKEYFYDSNDHQKLALVSICLSGLLGCFLITEVCENNGMQFFTAIYLPATILIWTMGIRTIKQPLVLSLPITLVFIISAGATVPSFISHMQRVYQGFQLKTGYSNNIMREGLNYRWGGTWNNDLLDAYTWLNQHTSKNAVILFSPHYEAEGNWWPPRTGFIRSAISDRQMVLEECWQKAILMEPDYPKRYADILNFYTWAIEPSENSKQKIAMFSKCFSESSPGIPLDQDKSSWRQLMHKLSFGKKWYGHNRMPQVAYEIGQLLTNEYHEKDALYLLDTYAITHIILENNDKPGAFLQSITKEIYKNKTILILEKIA